MGILQSDNELRDRLKLTNVHELAHGEKISYIDDQLNAIKHQLWRSRVDAVLNHNLKTTSEDEEVAVAAKIREHEGNSKRYAEAIQLLQALKDEL